jgi:hypothetical protein
MNKSPREESDHVRLVSAILRNAVPRQKQPGLVMDTSILQLQQLMRVSCQRMRFRPERYWSDSRGSLINLAGTTSYLTPPSLMKKRVRKIN